MRFLRNMQDSQSAAMRSFNMRLSNTEQHMAAVEAATAARLQNVEKLERLELGKDMEMKDTSARARITELEATIKHMDNLFKQFQDGGAPRDAP